MGNRLEFLDNIRWPDASLGEIVIDYDKVAVNVEESAGRRMLIQCENYISVNRRGQWDENIIERAEILDDAPEIQAALKDITKRYGPTPANGGGTRIFDGPWMLIRIWLIDDSKVDIIAQQVTVQQLTDGAQGRRDNESA